MDNITKLDFLFHALYVCTKDLVEEPWDDLLNTSGVYTVQCTLKRVLDNLQVLYNELVICTLYIVHCTILNYVIKEILKNSKVSEILSSHPSRRYPALDESTVYSFYRVCTFNLATLRPCLLDFNNYLLNS